MIIHGHPRGLSFRPTIPSLPPLSDPASPAHGLLLHQLWIPSPSSPRTILPRIPGWYFFSIIGSPNKTLYKMDVLQIDGNTKYSLTSIELLH